MNSDTQQQALPSLTAEILHDPQYPVDNLLAKLWKQLGIEKLLVRSGIHKRSGIPASQVVYLLILWTWLKVSSIHVFSRESLKYFGKTNKDALYDMLKREDINWRDFHTQIAIGVYRKNQLKASRFRAFVVDDSVKTRRGKKTEGVSRHFDHLTGRTVMGQQILTLGLATEKVFMPLDQDIFIGQKQVQAAQSFKDKRHCAAKRYQQSLELSKPELLAQQLKRALRNGFEADYLLADAWFGNRPILRIGEENDLTVLVRMKKGNTQYRYTSYVDGKCQHEMLDAKELFKKQVRKQWEKQPGTRYQAKYIDVEIDISETSSDIEKWRKVRLLFVRGASDTDKESAGKHDWALFLTTDCSLSPQTMLEIYALRWGIEVYFKECKQHLGLLKEQTISFASHLASISLTAIRYLLLLHASLEQGNKICETREQMSSGLTHLDFGQKLWALFRSLIHDTLESFRAQLGSVADEFMAALEERINAFFVQALQLDAFTLELEARDSLEME
jgi:SRSO17 transposase